MASACKSNGCATLVGKRTGGDGIGCDPALLVLPNSKIVFRYSMIYGLNADGSCNAEIGTEPDILSQDNESPLDTCLKEIKIRTKIIKKNSSSKRRKFKIKFYSLDCEYGEFVDNKLPDVLKCQSAESKCIKKLLALQSY